MEIHLNISFPRMPCELLTLDVMDVSGEQQVGVMHGVNKVRLAPVSQGGHVIEVKALDLCVSSPSTSFIKHFSPALFTRRSPPAYFPRRFLQLTNPQARRVRRTPRPLLLRQLLRSASTPYSLQARLLQHLRRSTRSLCGRKLGLRTGRRRRAMRARGVRQTAGRAAQRRVPDRGGNPRQQGGRQLPHRAGPQLQQQ